jgi:hypothetical protein
MFPAVTVKVAELAPAGIVTEAMGTGSKLLLLTSVTTVPPGGAVLFKLTVHDVDPPEFKVDALQKKEVSTGGGVILPPVSVVANGSPDAEEAWALLMAMAVAFTPCATDALIVARTPLPIRAPFRPLSRQLRKPDPETQLNALLLLLAADPGVAEIDKILAAG